MMSRALVGPMLRRRKLEIAVVAVITAVLLGGAMSATAGARRSASAVDRFLAFSPAEDVFLVPPDDGSLDLGAVNRLPQVSAAQAQAYLAMVPVAPDGRPQMELTGSINPFLIAPIVGPADAIGRRRLIKGRDLDENAPLEVQVDEELAHQRHLEIGSHLVMAAYSGAQLDQVLAPSSGTVAPAGPVVDLTVVGIVRVPTDLHPTEGEHTTLSGGTKDIYLTPALYREFGDQLAAFNPPGPNTSEAIRLVHGSADVDAFTQAIHALPGGEAASIQTGGSDALDSARTARRAISVETAALVALAALLALGGLLLFTHAAARMARRTSHDLGVLRAIGLGPRELQTVAALPAVAAALVAALLAVVIAVATSPMTPIGLGRLAEIDPGFHFDAVVLLVGVGAVAALTLAIAVATSRPTAKAVARSQASGADPHTGLADWLADIGAPLGATLGGRFATDRRVADRAAPVRSAMAVGALSLLVLVAVATYNASLADLTSTPVDQGVTWDIAIGNPNLSTYTDDDVARLAADPHVAGVLAAAAPESRGTVNGSPVTIAGVDVTRGVAPRVLDGHLPEHSGEVALGRHTAAQLHVHVGDTVSAGFDGPSTPLKVVGVALLNPGMSPTMQIGDGAIVTLDQIQSMVPDQAITFLLTRLRPGTDVDATISALRPQWGLDISRAALAPDVVNLDRVRTIPTALALALGGGATALLAFTLIVSVINRRRDLSVLRSIGATRRQLTNVLSWQAVWLYAAAVVIGVPTGIIVGRLAWNRIDDDLGARVAAVIPAGRLALIVAIGLVLVLLLAYVPARLALRDRPARWLRVE